MALVGYFVDISSEYLSGTSPSLTTVRNELPDNLASQSNNEGAVMVTVTPKLSEGVWEFEIKMDTHSVELSEDMVESSVLIVNGGEYKPVIWEGDLPGGHHREGILKFGPTSPRPESIILRIRQIGGIDEQDFVWTTAP